MSEKKDKYFLAVGIVSGAFITLFYDLFEYWLNPLFPDEATAFVKTSSATLAIVGGLLVLKFYIKYPIEKEIPKKRSLWDKFWNGSE